MNIFGKTNRKRGFSLAEVMIVVVIIGILLAVAAPDIIAYYRELKLTELDDSARTIFMAAQNEISAILAADKKGVPAVAGQEGSCEYPGGATVNFDYLSTTTDADSLHKIVPGGSIESQLQGNNYIVEYNHETGAVHAVWYWEDGTDFDYQKNYTLDPNNADKPHATKDARIKVPVGYYGGGDVDRITVKQMPIPELTLINAEELQLTIKVPKINGATGDFNNNIRVDVMVNGTPIVTGANLWNGGDPGTVVLDTLRPREYSKDVVATSHNWTVGAQFKDWLVAGSSIQPGDNITVSVKLYYNGTAGTGTDERALLPQVVSVTTNSLFADVKVEGTDKVAEIAYGRHLQNLDSAISGVDTSITAAEQTREIDFNKSAAGADQITSWKDTYPAVSFISIYNKNLTSYDGRSLPIRNLDAEENPGATGHTTDAGLFAYIEGAELKDITLINAKVTGADDVGALIGETAGTVNVSGCKVYVDDDLTYDPTKTLNPYITSSGGGSVGGLIGSAGGTVTISNSFASTLEGSTGNAGGLVGSANADTTITGSYAAGYLEGSNVGGLVGVTSGTVTVENSYAAGIIASATTAGGLVGDGTVTITDSYAAVRYSEAIETGSKTSPATVTVYGVAPSAGTTAYYIKQSGVTYQAGSGEMKNTDDLKTALSSASWSTPPGDTHAYGLTDETKGLVDKIYPYPMLNAMPHYGDWLENMGGDVMLAYIEQYGTDDYKIYAAKASSANGTDATIIKNGLDPNEIVIDDFYRIVSPTELTGWKFKLDDDDMTEYELTADSVHPTIETGGVTYYCYTLTEAGNWDSKVNYYHEIKFETQKLAFIYNPFFACEAFDVSEFEYPDGGVPSADVHIETRRSKPEMGRHVTGTLTDTDVFIRSARQLANIQAYTNDATIGSTAQDWVYDQLLDVNFDKYSGDVAGGKTATGRLDPATLKNGAYDGHGKTISNLYIGPGAETTNAAGDTEYAPAGLFGTVTGGEVRHVRLVNIDLDLSNGASADSAAIGGLVGRLSGGKVDDCGIYVVADGTTTTGSIDASYNNKTIKGSGANGVGGLIGQIQSGNVSDSFAAVKVKGTAETATVPENPVGGFVGQFNDGTITNCYAGGYVDATSKTYKNDSVNVTGNNNVGGFVGSVATNSAIFTGINYSTASVGGPNHDQVGLFAGAVATNFSVNKTAVMLNAVAKAFKAETTGSTTTYTDEAPRDESDYMGGTATGEPTVTAEPYNQTETTFPYPSGQKVHHGDWIEFDVCGLYYDTVGSTTGYYAIGNKVDSLPELASGRPGSGDIATDDGYMFVTKENLGDITIRVGEKSFLMTPDPSTMTINGETYNYKYEVPAEALNTPTANYYNAVSINGRIFYANFGVACEIFDSVTDPNKPMPKSGISGLADPYEGIVVRSARQLANIGIRSNVGEYNNLNTKVYTGEAVAIQEAAISQVLDIDYAKYTATYKNAAGKDVSKIPEAVVLDGSNNANHTPITINGGSYDGHNYEIRNLVPGMIRQITSVSGTAVNEVQIQSGLVGRITGGKIENVTLINATVENDAQKAVEASTNITSGGTVEWDPAGDISHILIDTDWLTGTGESDPGGGKNAPLSGKTATYTDGQNFTFTAKWISNNNNKFYHDNTTYDFDGCRTKCRVYFSGSISGDGNYVEFETKNVSTIKVWWMAGGSDNSKTRAVSVLTSTDRSTGKLKEDKVAEGTTSLLVCEDVEPGTYYVGCTSSGNYIIKIEVIEHTKEKENVTTPGTTTPTAPVDDTFPTGTNANSYKARFGALVGAVNPANKTPNEVTITNCGVYVELESGADTDAYTTAYNKYSVKNTGTTGFKEDTVGGLIGMATQGTTIEKSYAAVKVEGNYSVGGFIGHLKNATISDCYSGGHTVDGAYSTTDYNVTARNKDEGYAGGFAGQIENTGVHDNLKFESVNYSTASANGGAKAGNFAGEIPALGSNWDGFGTAQVYGIGAIAGPVITDERMYLDATVTMHAYNTIDLVPAEPYDDVLKDVTTGKVTYPYIKTDGQTVHHGDWPMRYNLIYYELYKGEPHSVTTDIPDDKTGEYTIEPRDIKLTAADQAALLGTDAEYIGFYGVFPVAGSTGNKRVVNTLRVDGTVYDSGYMVVSDRSVDDILMTINSYYVNNNDLDNNPGVTFDENNQPLHATTVKTSAKIDFTGRKIPVGSSGETEEDATKLIGNYGYIIPAEGLLLPAASKSFYLDTQINGQTYIFNPQFPCEAINVEIDHLVGDKYEINYDEIRIKPGINYVKKNDDGTTQLFLNREVDELIIRTPANLAGMTRFSRPSNNGLVKDKIIEYDFVQHMDVDYNKYAENHVYDGYTPNRSDAVKDSEGNDLLDEFGNKQYNWYRTGQEDYGQVPAVLDGGTYDGMGHTISNLYLQNDNSSSQYVGLFGQLRKGAKVSNLIMENIHMTADGMGSDDIHVDNASLNAGALAAVVTDSTIENVTINGVEISFKDKEYKTTKDKNGVDKYEGLWFEGVGGAIGKIAGKAPTGAEASASVTNVKVNTPEISVTIEKQNNKNQLNVGGAIGKIDGGEANGTTPSVSVTDVTVTDPTITVEASGDTFSTGTKVGGFVGSADGSTFSYTATATGADTRSVNITDSGVYMSETNKGKFNDMGISVTGTVTGDEVGGFAGFLGKGVNVTRDYSAIRVEGKTYAGGFAGYIQGSHVEDCYSGGYVEASGSYSTREYNVTGGTAGGFAGRIQVAYESGNTGPMAMYMTGVNYTTSSAKGTTKVGVFAGEADDAAIEALAEKMGGIAPVIYAGGTTSGTKNEEKHVKTGSAMPRKDNDRSGFTTYKYNATGDVFPYDTNQNAHHGDWVDSPLNAAGYWEVENGKLRLWYIPSDTPDAPVELTEEGATGFGHDSRDAVGITESGYFVVSSDTRATFSGITGLTVESTYGETIKKLLGGDSVAVQVYELHNGKSNNQEWNVNGEKFTVNPAYAKAIEYGTASTLGTATPYEIRTVKQLENIGDGNTNSFKQSHDIVFDSTTATSYNSIENFQGSYDGGEYRILDIDEPVFDTVAGGTTVDDPATIKNVIVYAPEGNKPITGNGGIANSTSGTVTIENTIVAGFTINGSGGDVGGLVGTVTGGELTIKNSEATNTLSGANVGGLVGNVSAAGTLNVEQSYAGGKIASATTSAGGLVGAGTGATVTYQDVYSYVDMKDSSAGTCYGIGPGTVKPASMLQEYWSTGLDGKTASDSAPIEGAALADIKKDCQDLFAMSAEEYMKPDATQGLENLAEGAADEEAKFALFPFAAFVTDGAGDNYHYGDFPKTDYVGAFYHELENGAYHFYAYGGEIYDGKVYQMKLLDTLCYDHHLNGERESISETGYGVFYTGDWTVSVSDGTTGTADSTVVTKFKEAFGLDGTFTVESLSGTGTRNLITVNFGGTQNFKVVVNPAFAAAFAKDNSDGSMGESESNPVQIRTFDQLQKLTASTGVTNRYANFAITHDIDAKDQSYTSGEINGAIKSLNGNGYRILDLKIEGESAGLFTKANGTVTIKGIILYAPNNDGVITANNGNAGGILASAGSGVTIENCVVSGYTIKGTQYVGGIIGNMTNVGASVTNCQAINTLEGIGTGVKGIGGIAGRGYGNAASGFENCYAGGVIKNANSGTPVGGIYGDVSDTPTVKNCYSYMDLTDSTNKGTKYAIGEASSGIDTDTNYYLTENAGSATSQGTAQTFAQLCDQRADATTAKYVYVPNAANPDDGLTSWGAGAYPMAAKVTVSVRAGVDTGIDESGDVLVHYGDWPYSVRAAGIAYWEKVGGNYYFKAVWVDHSGAVKTYSGDDDKFCTDHHVNGATGAIEEHKITDSGYVFFTTNKDLKIALPTHQVAVPDGTSGTKTETRGAYDGLPEAGDRADVIKALNEKLKVKCLDGETSVYSNGVFATGGVVDATSTVTLTKTDGTTVAQTFYCNPGMSGVAAKQFRDEYKLDTSGGTVKEELVKKDGIDIEIRTVEQLDNIPDKVSAGFHFKQTHDLYGKDYKAGSDPKYTGADEFAGTYDGQGYKILDLNMSGADKDVGLFASINSYTCELRNIIMYAPNGATISGTGTTGDDATDDHYGVGGLVGSISKGSTGTAAKIENCVVAGYTIKGQQHVGGLIGWGFHGANIKNCAAVNDIECTTIVAAKDNENGADNSGAGGILGGYGSNSAGKTEITNCYTGGTIKVSGDNASNAVVGGICGKNGNTSDHAKVTNCYTYVDLHECAEAKVSVISSSENSSNASNYYLNDSARIPNWVHKQGEGKTYAELKATIFTGTDFGTATKSYVTTGKRAGEVEKSVDGYTPMEKQTTTTSFPFPEVQINGEYVHYGEWPAKNSTSTSSYPWENGKIGVILGYSGDNTFGADSDVVAMMFDGSSTVLGTTTKAAIDNYIGLVIGDVPAGQEAGLRNHLRVLYYQGNSSEYEISSDGKTLTIKGKCTAVYEFSSGTEVGTFNNSSAFSDLKLYGVKPTKTTSSSTTDVTITKDGDELLVLVYDSGVDANTLNISMDNIVGWVKVSDLDAKKTGTGAAGSSPATPEGPSFEGIMAPAVTDAIMPEKFKLPEPENIDENGDDGQYADR